MDISELYMTLPFDTSGSMSKNRFRAELLWGVNKMLDIYDYDDFAVVFDYVCDIEIHSRDGLEFFQIKTHKSNQTFTINKIIKIDGKSKNSIIGKLYILKTLDEAAKIKVALVSNLYLNDGKKTYTNLETVPFSQIDEKSIMKIRDALKKELKDEKNINLEDIFYINTTMDLNDPKENILGKLVLSFERITGYEPKKPYELYRFIYDTVSSKACCELDQPDYEELIKNKGITKNEFSQMLSKYIDNIDSSVELVRKYIDENVKNIMDRRKMKGALAQVVGSLNFSMELKSLETEMANFLFSSKQLPDSFEECIEFLLKSFSEKFSIEFSTEERLVFIILVLKKFEEGVYDDKVSL